MHIILKLLSKIVPPKDTKPHFLNNIPQRNPFPGKHFPLHGFYVSVVAVVIFLFRVYIYNPVICAGTYNGSIYTYREREKEILYSIIFLLTYFFKNVPQKKPSPIY